MDVGVGHEGNRMTGGLPALRFLVSGHVIIVNASARPPRLAGLPTVGTCNYRYTGIQVRYTDTVICQLHTQ